MRARIVVALSIITALVFAFLVVRQMAALRDEVDRLRAETCIEFKLTNATNALDKIEVKWLHRIPVDGPSDELNRMASSYTQAQEEILGRVYPISPPEEFINRLGNTCPPGTFSSLD